MDLLKEEILRINKEKAYAPLTNAEISQLNLPDRDTEIEQIIFQKTKLPRNSTLRNLIKDFHEKIRNT